MPDKNQPQQPKKPNQFTEGSPERRGTQFENPNSNPPKEKPQYLDPPKEAD